MAASRTTILLGQCLPCIKANASKFKVRKMVLDQNLNMVIEEIRKMLLTRSGLTHNFSFQYFKKDEFIFAHDPGKLCKTGDIVLIRALPQKMTKLITHSVERIVHQMGDIVDPITGKKVVVGRYRDDIEADMEAYGKSEKAFSYDKAPPRGRLEGTRDFTHGETYIKYHDDGKDQPFAV